MALNCACNEQIVLKDVAYEIAKYLGMEIQPEFLTDRRGDIKHSLADISLAQKLIGYKPIVNFREGLNKTIDYFMNNIK